MMGEIEKLRAKIDEIDMELIRLLEERARICKEIGGYKRKIGAPIRVPEREAEVLRRAGPFSHIFQEIIRLCLEVEEAV